MPYFITDKHPDCEAWATVKDDGELLACHATEQQAIDQMVAVSISEELEPGGTYEGSFRSVCEDCDGNCDVCETRALPGELSVGDYVRWIVDDEVYFGEVYGLREGEATIKVYDEEDGVLVEKDLIALVPIASLEKIEAPITQEPMDHEEDRAVDLTPPAFMRAAARQGLRYYEQGLGGDGLVERTIREARAMAEGNVTAEKWVRIRAWIARHLGDLDAPDANPNSDGYPSAGVVAHLLWGSGPSKRSAQRALEFANRVIAKIEAENEGRAKGEALSKMETRLWTGNLEIRSEGDGMLLTGYAALFNSWSEDLGGFREQIAPGAFKRSLKSRNDVKLLWNHETGEVLGSTRAGTLKLTEDERGLRVEALLPDTQRGRDAKVLIQRGDVSGFSFGFSVAERGDSWNAEGNERTLKSVRLFETSLTPFPAYTSTNGTASVRGIDKLAQRTGVDADALADAIIKVEEGKDLSPDERDLLVGAIDSLAPKIGDDSSVEMLNLKKKKLDLLKLMEGN